MTDLKDFEARRRIKEDVDVTLFVEAGAGAGKTHSLVQRLLTLILEREVPVGQIAAITFTKKAAAELSERLSAALAAHGDNPVAQRALLELPSAAIETLHSFCQRLLFLYPLEAGIPPEITVQDSFAAARQSLALERRVKQAFTQGLEGVFPIAELSGHKILDSDFHEALEYFAVNRGSVPELLDLAHYMDDNWGELRPTLAAPLPEACPFDAAAAEVVLLKLRKVYERCTDPSDKFAVTLSRQLDDLRSRIDAGDLSPLPAFRKERGGSKNAWGGVNVSEVKAECADIWDEWNERLEKASHRPIAVLRAALAFIVIENARTRHRTGELQFGDLVYLADELLTDHAHVRADAHARFTHLLVDEFQDTDPAQYRIVRAIATDPATGELAPGALFTVGDPKQSIYRFRHADLDTYLAARDGGDGELVELTTNFRSTRKILDWSNEVFGRYFPTAMEVKSDTDPRLVPREVGFTELAARPGVDDSHSRTIVADYGADKELGLSKEEAECAVIVHHIKQALAEEWPRRVKGADGLEHLVALQPQDIAILVRTHRQARYLMSYLEAEGVPYVAEGSALTYLAPEIEEFHVVLHAAADPAETLSVGAALRTSLLGISDKQLAEWATSWSGQPGRAYNIYLSDFEKVTGPIPEALKLLKELHLASRTMSVGEFVSWAVDRLALPQLVAARSVFPLEALRRLEFVKHNARAFTAATHGTLREYTAWTDSLETERHQLTDPEATTAGGVRILTLHASKGREFPMVIMAGMYGGTNNNPSVTSLHPADHVLEYKHSSLRSPHHREILAHEKLADAAERARLFYVAATRARDHLVVCRRRDRDRGLTATTLNTAIADALEAGAIAGVVNAAELQPVAYEFPAPVAPRAQESASAEPNAAAEFVAATSSAWSAARPRRFGVTTLVHAPDEKRSEFAADLPQLELDPAWEIVAEKRDHHGTEIGTALHAMMEAASEGIVAGTVSLADMSDERLTQLAADCGAPVEFHPTITAMAGNLLRSEVIAKAFGGEHYQELPVFGRLWDGGPVIDAVVDLVYRDGDAWVVADYKTDMSAKPESVRDYFAQLKCYAALLSGILDAPIARLELLFPRTGGFEVRTLIL